MDETPRGWKAGRWCARVAPTELRWPCHPARRRSRISTSRTTPPSGTVRRHRVLGSQRLRGLHPRGYSVERPLHRRGGDQDPRTAGHLGRQCRATVRPVLPPGLRHVPERRPARPRGQQRPHRVCHVDVRVLDGVRERCPGQEGPRSHVHAARPGRSGGRLRCARWRLGPRREEVAPERNRMGAVHGAAPTRHSERNQVAARLRSRKQGQPDLMPRPATATVATMGRSVPYVVRVVVRRVPGVGGADDVDDQRVRGQVPVRGR